MIEQLLFNYKICIDSQKSGIHKYVRHHADQLREPELLYILKKELLYDSIFLDIGANIGYIILYVSMLNRAKKIYAIEPDPDNITYLQQTIKSNMLTNVELYKLALGDIQQTLTFYPGKTESNLGSLIPSKNTMTTGINIQSTTLDLFLKDKEYPDIIKMDIEGGEVFVLEGINELLKDPTFKPKIVMELHPDVYTNQFRLDVSFNKLYDAGFNIKYVISAGIAQPEIFKKYGYNPVKVFPSGNFKRGLYTNVTNQHALQICCFLNQEKNKPQKSARFVMLERTLCEA